jgi:hypothetical protein
MTSRSIWLEMNDPAATAAPFPTAGGARLMKAGRADALRSGDTPPRFALCHTACGAPKLTGLHIVLIFLKALELAARMVLPRSRREGHTRKNECGLSVWPPDHAASAGPRLIVRRRLMDK